MVSEIGTDILHKAVSFTSIDAQFDFMHPVNTFAVSLDGKTVGFISVPHPVVCQNIDKKCAIAFFEICTESFASVAPGAIKYEEPSKFPSIDMDMTFNVDLSAVNFDTLTATAKSTAGDILADVKVQDIYTSDAGTSLTVRFVFVSKERTLTKQEIAPAMDAIVSALGLEVKV